MPDLGRLLILADDFTGACDASAAFAASQKTLVVHGRPMRWPTELPPVDVLGVDLDLRERPVGIAESITREAARTLESTRLFLKIDSTLRGPIAALVAGALQGSGRQVAVIAPAFPEQGRLLRNGALEVDGQLGASLTDALGMAGTALLGANFARSAREVELAVEHARTRDAQRVVVDTDSAECLRSVARAWQGHAADWLLVGSAGLARQVAEPANAAQITHAQGTVLVVAGSPAPATQLQIARLRSLEASVPELVVLSTAPADERDAGESARAIADLAAAWARDLRPGAVVLAGGATARFVCERLGAQGVHLEGELRPGVPFGHLVGGTWDGVRVVTKAGGFGQPETLLDVVQALGVSSLPRHL